MVGGHWLAATTYNRMTFVWNAVQKQSVDKGNYFVQRMIEPREQKNCRGRNQCEIMKDYRRSYTRYPRAKGCTGHMRFATEVPWKVLGLPNKLASNHHCLVQVLAMRIEPQLDKSRTGIALLHGDVTVSFSTVPVLTL